jgi:hypothetical protein
MLARFGCTRPSRNRRFDIARFRIYSSSIDLNTKETRRAIADGSRKSLASLSHRIIPIKNTFLISVHLRRASPSKAFRLTATRQCQQG